MIESPDMTTKGIVFEFPACKVSGHMKPTAKELQPSDPAASQTVSKQFHTVEI